MLAIQTPLPVRIYREATYRVDGSGLPEFLSNSSDTVLRGPLTLAIRDGGMLSHYFHWIEMILGLYIFHNNYFPHLHASRLMVGHQIWNNPNQNNVQAKILKSLYPKIEVVESNALEGATLENVICVDRWLAFADHSIPNNLNKFLEPFLPIAFPHTNKFRTTLVESVPLVDTPYRTAQIKRDLPRTFEADLSARLISMFGGNVLDFATMPWEEQVAHSMNKTFMYGVHGNGLTNMIWMPAGSVLFEFFPENIHHYDYQLLAELFGLTYFGFQGQNVWREFSRNGDAFGHNPEQINVPVRDINWASLNMALHFVK